MGVGGDHDHHVGRDPVRAVGTAGVPVGEVADPDQHGHADLVDVERERLLLDLDVADVHLRQVDPLDGCRRRDHVDPVLLGTRLVDGDLDALPGLGTVVGGQRRPVGLVLEPAHPELEIALALVAGPRLDHHRLGGKRRHDFAVGQFVDRPRRRLGYQGELGPVGGLGLGGVAAQHHVADAERLELGHPGAGVELGVAQLAYRVGAGLRHRRRRHEVVRRRARRLEEQTLHRTDASVGPERQQHQRHRRAVAAVAVAVLPEGSTAAVLGSQVVHRLHDVVVFGVRSLVLVALEVVRRPADALGLVDGALGLGWGSCGTAPTRTPPCRRRSCSRRRAGR